MYLTEWMIITLIMSFGLCAIINYYVGRKIGIVIGGTSMLEVLDEKKIIMISEEGVVSRYNDPPKRKKRKIS